MGLSHNLIHRPIASLNAHWKRVDKHSHGWAGVYASLHASEQYGAKYHVLTPRHSGQHQGPGDMAESGGAHLQLACAFPKASRQSAIKYDLCLLNTGTV